jgi:outer membrane protein
LNKLWDCALAASLALVASSAVADTKIGYVAIEKLMQSPQSLEAGKKLQKEFTPRNADLQVFKKQVDDKEAALTKEAPTQSESVRRSKMQELNNLKIEFERKQREMHEDFEIRKKEEQSSLQTRINEAVTSVAQAEGYDLVLYNTAAYVGKKTDITDKVLKVLK